MIRSDFQRDAPCRREECCRGELQRRQTSYPRQAAWVVREARPPRKAVGRDGADDEQRRPDREDDAACDPVPRPEQPIQQKGRDKREMDHRARLTDSRLQRREEPRDEFCLSAAMPGAEMAASAAYRETGLGP